jgi:hypothetical protein
MAVSSVQNNPCTFFVCAPSDVVINILSRLRLPDIKYIGSVDKKLYCVIFTSNINSNLIWERVFGRCFPKNYELTQNTPNLGNIDYRKLLHYKAVMEPSRIRNQKFIKRELIMGKIFPETVIHCSFLPNNSVLACLSSGKVFIWNQKDELIQTFNIDIPANPRWNPHLHKIHVENDQIHLFLGASDDSSESSLVHTYDLEGHPLQKPVSFKSDFECSSCTEIWGGCVVRGSCGTIKVFDLKTGVLLNTIEGRGPQKRRTEYELIDCVDMDNHYIAAGVREVLSFESSTSFVNLWDRNGIFLHLFPIPSFKSLRSVRIQEDRLFIHTNYDITCWSLNSFAEIRTLPTRPSLLSFDVYDDYLIALPDFDPTEPPVVYIRNFNDPSESPTQTISLQWGPLRISSVCMQGSSLCVNTRSKLHILDFSTPQALPPPPPPILQNIPRPTPKHRPLSSPLLSELQISMTECSDLLGFPFTFLRKVGIRSLDDLRCLGIPSLDATKLELFFHSVEKLVLENEESLPKDPNTLGGLHAQQQRAHAKGEKVMTCLNALHQSILDSKLEESYPASLCAGGKNINPWFELREKVKALRLRLQRECTTTRGLLSACGTHYAQTVDEVNQLIDCLPTTYRLHQIGRLRAYLAQDRLHGTWQILRGREGLFTLSKFLEDHPGRDPFEMT